jgi:hypothetical protein
VAARKSNTFWARAARLHAHLFGEERVDVGFEDQWIDNSSMADRDPTLTVDKNAGGFRPNDPEIRSGDAS